MKIEYQLIDFHERTGSLQVRYFNEDLPDGIMFSFNLPLTDGKYPQGEALEALINGYAPQDIFQRAADIKKNAPSTPAGVPQVKPPAQPPMLFKNQPLFVQEGSERILMVRPLVQKNSMDIPVEVY